MPIYISWLWLIGAHDKHTGNVNSINIAVGELWLLLEFSINCDRMAVVVDVVVVVVVVTSARCLNAGHHIHTCNHNMIASFNATKNNTRITICTKEEMNYVRACTRTHIHTRARLHRLLCIVSLILLETVCFLILWLLLCELVPFVCVLCPGSILFLNCNWHLCFSIALSNRLTASFMLCTLLWPTFDFMIDCSMAFSS